MNKKKIILASGLVVIGLLAAVVAFYPVDDQEPMWTYVEGMEENTVICRCSDSVFSNSKCKTTNTGEICAMSEPGGNIKCSEYKANCSRVLRMVKSARLLVK